MSNGGIAVVVTTEARARSLAQPPVPVLGWAQSHPGHLFDRDENFGLVTGAAQSGPAALAMAGVGIDDVDVAELYDCYTFTVLVSLEDYGFCEKGDGGRLCLQRGPRPRRQTEVQHRGRAAVVVLHVGHDAALRGRDSGARPGRGRQVHPHEVVLVSGNGGILDHHATLVLGS